MENIKSKIIPEELKINIDEIMEKQLFNANRYYAESNPFISDLMKKELDDIPAVFLRRLQDRWKWHNCYYEKLLEPAFQTLIKNNEKELSPTEIDDLIKVYITSCLVDEATLVMSGAIKKYIDYNYEKISISDENSSELQAKYMLITPPIETFFAQYQFDHLYYIYMIKVKDKNVWEFKKHLKSKYHANDELIFQSRFKKDFFKYINFSEKEILKEIKKYTIPDDYKIRHAYFTLEHPDRKAFRDIIVYDNLDEKLISSNLIGISGFLLRKKILEYLNNSQILPNNGFIYEFNNDIVISALEKLKQERNIKMDKDIKPYKQRGDTCAIACLMMALEYYHIMDKANWHDEKRLYKVYGSKYMAGTPFSALAFHLSKNGLDIAIYHSDKNLFNNNNKNLSENDFNLAMDEYKVYLDRAISKGTRVINGVNIDAKLLKEQLKDGKTIILAGELTNAYHAILISGYEDDKFIVCDPLYKTKQIKSADELNKFMDTSIGKWFIAISDKTKEKEKLMQNLDNFSSEASSLMNVKEGKVLKHGRK